MDNILPTLLVFGFLAFFAFMLYIAIKTTRAESAKKQQTAQALGFTLVEPDERLFNKIQELYLSGTRGKKFRLNHVSRKMLPDGEMYLFDLIETSGDDNSTTEGQAVAIVSPHLNLPFFVLHPKVDTEKYKLGGLANSLMRWATNYIGTPVDFPEYPDFDKKYIVSAPYPEDVRLYFDASLAHGLARTSMCNIYAGGDIFTFSQLNPQAITPDQNVLSQRVNLAMDVFRLLLKI